MSRSNQEVASGGMLVEFARSAVTIYDKVVKAGPLATSAPRADFELRVREILGMDFEAQHNQG